MGMSGLPPIPDSDTAQVQSPMSSLLPQGPQAPAPDVQEKSRAVMSQLRQLMSSVDALAQQFPAGAKPARRASEALKEFMVAVVSDMNKTQTSAPAPKVLG